MTYFHPTETWKATYPDAHAGVLVMHKLINPPTHAGLEARKMALEDDIRARFAGQDRTAVEAIPTIQAYAAYYAGFKKTYHVQVQLESIAFKGRTIPNVASLVEAMFMAEVKNLLLTAGHDLDSLELPLTMAVARGKEAFTTLRGQIAALKTGDMYMADASGVVSSIIYGPDERTQIRAQTHNVLFAVYAPAGIPVDAVHDHLREIEQNVRLVAPHAETELLEVYGAR
ncbi:MAG TPA: phenylalanine--tRNA ligase beta subunit-related protein [Anaerolineaceae bacterium]